MERGTGIAIVTRMRIILFVCLFSFPLFASQQQIVGVFSPIGMHNFTIKCEKKEIESIQLTAGRPQSCHGNVRIKSLSLTYDSGLSQVFEYSDDTGNPNGAILTTTSFQVLPGTKCVTKIKAQVSVQDETEKNCLSRHRIQVAVVR
jgi:hypothetical protein